MTFEKNIGSRAQVWHGTAKKTSGGLTKTHLMMNKHGRIISRKKHSTAKKENRLVKAGFLTKKGSFGSIKKGSRKMRGGTGFGVGPGNPSNPQVAAMNGPNSSVFAAPAGVIAKGLQSGYKTGGKKHHSRYRMKGGSNGLNYPLNPAPFDGKGVGTSGVAVQFAAGLGN